MVFLYVSTSGLVPACKYSITSIVLVFVIISGLVPAYKYDINSMVSLLLELQSFSLQECK